MDVNGDGIRDIFSGSYTKGLFYFLGKDNGTFADKVGLKDVSGKAVNPSSALGAKLFDWDGDGDLDVVTGTISGPVYFIENVGDMKFGEAVEMTSGGKPIYASDGGVCFGDFDGDGLTDLVLGDDNGLAIYYCPKLGATELGEPQYIVKNENPWELKKFKDSKTLVLTEPNPGTRLKPCVTDWNGDGKLDIIVGDYTNIQPPQKDLTAEEKQELAELEEKSSGLSGALMKHYERIQDEIYKKLGIKSVQNMSEEESYKYREAIMEAYDKDEGLKKAMEDYQKVYSRLGELQGRPQSHGFVWVFLQK